MIVDIIIYYGNKIWLDYNEDIFDHVYINKDIIIICDCNDRDNMEHMNFELFKVKIIPFNKKYKFYIYANYQIHLIKLF